MAETVRFGISIDERLLNRFDALIDEKGYSNRSEAIRDLIRNALVEEEWARENSHHKEIISALHVHLDAHHCLEVVVIKGKAKKIKKLAEELIGTKGVKHGKLMTSTTGKGLI
jgi:CopG family nickel-responsive transcriptional regulator